MLHIGMVGLYYQLGSAVSVRKSKKAVEDSTVGIVFCHFPSYNIFAHSKYRSKMSSYGIGLSIVHYIHRTFADRNAFRAEHTHRLSVHKVSARGRNSILYSLARVYLFYQHNRK